MYCPAHFGNWYSVLHIVNFLLAGNIGPYSESLGILSSMGLFVSFNLFVVQMIWCKIYNIGGTPLGGLEAIWQCLV